MAGHSKWSKIKRKKAANDSKRSKMMSKMIRELTVAAREGGGDPDANPRLRAAVSNARAENIPNDTIENAILRGSGQLEGAAYEDVNYEGYAPHGVALYIEAATDNRNRTTAEVRHTLTKHGGTLGERNSVAWQFERKGSILVEKREADEETVMFIALDAGAEDVVDADEDLYEVVTTPETFYAALKALEGEEIAVSNASLEMLPTTLAPLGEQEASAVLKLIDALEDLDDVSNVYANFDIDESIIERHQESAA